MFTNVSRPSAVDVLRPFVVGDTFYADTTSTLAKRAIGSTNDVLIVSGGVPVWSSTVVLTSLSVIDSGFSIIGSADATKKLMFEVDAQTPGDTLTISTGAQTDSRTLSVPVLAGADTIATLAVANAFTGNNTMAGTLELTTASNGLTISKTTGTTLTVSSTTDSTSKDTGSIVTEGGLGVEKAGFFGTNLTALGTVGFGGARSSSGVIAVGFSNPLTGSSQVALITDLTANSAATSNVRGFQTAIQTAAASFTCGEATSISCGTIVKGSGSTITRAYSLRTYNPTEGGTCNIGIANNSAITETGNWFIYDGGTYASRFGGAVTFADTTDSTSITTGSIICSGGIGVAKRLTLDGGTGKTLRIVNGVANAAVATTLGSVGPTGSTAGNPQGWMRVDINGTDRYIPYW